MSSKARARAVPRTRMAAGAHNEPANVRRRRNMAFASLSLCCFGMVLLVTGGMVARVVGSDGALAFLMFIGCELAALALGLTTWSFPNGRAGAIGSAVLMLITLLLVQ